MRPRLPNEPRPRLVDTEEQARRDRETFMDRKSSRQKRMPFTWPLRLQKIGKCLAVEYRSDKWHSVGDNEEYKHVAEGPQDLLACRDFLTPWGDPRQPLPVHGAWVTLLQPMPKHFAELAPLLGVQAHLYGADGRLRTDRQGIVEIRVARGMLGGARHPKGNTPFLFVYSASQPDGMHAIITGAQLSITKDGIAG